MPTRYRRSCLNAYSNRRERSQNLDNNNAHPNIYGLSTPPVLPTLQWTENFAYADGTFAVVAAANWSGFTHTFGGVNADFTTLGGQFLTAGTANSLSSKDQTEATTGATLFAINAGLPWAYSINIVSLLNGHVISNGQNCGFLLQFIDAAANSYNLTITYDASVGVVLLVDRNGVTKITSNRGTPAAYTANVIMYWDGTNIKLYEGNTLLGSVASPTLNAALRRIQIMTTGVNHASGTCVILGNIKAYGSAV